MTSSAFFISLAGTQPCSAFLGLNRLNRLPLRLGCQDDQVQLDLAEDETGFHPASYT